MTAVAKVTSARRGERIGRKLSSHRVLGIICGGFVALVCLLAVLAPVLAPYDPNKLSLGAAYEGSSFQHLLGTDGLGRDLLSRLIYGGRAPLLGAILIVILATVMGSTLAVTAAWVGGRTDSVVGRVLDVVLAFPGLVLAILAVSVFGTGLVAPVIALAVAYTPYVARVVRSVALRERALPYVDALYVHGFSARRICIRHILRNLYPFIIVQATVSVGYALVDLAGLSFIGLGVQPPASDWGLMVANGEPDILAGHSAQSLYAGLIIVVTVLSFMVLGERLGKAGTRSLRG